MGRFFFPALVGAAIFASLGLSGRRLSHQIAESDLDAAAALVRESFAQGDLVVVEPPYMVGPRQRLGDLPLIEPHKLVPEDLVGVTRVRLVSLDVIGAQPDLAVMLDHLGSLEADQAFGGVTVRTYVLASTTRVALDLRAVVKDLRVTVRYADGVEAACSIWDRDRWTCPRDPSWSYVGRETLNIDSEARDCVWMHPVPATGVLRIELPVVEGVRLTGLAGGLGFALEAANRVKSPVHVAIWVGNELVLTRDHAPGVEWERFNEPLLSSAQPIRIEVSTKDNGASHFCMGLKLLTVAP